MPNLEESPLPSPLYQEIKLILKIIEINGQL